MFNQNHLHFLAFLDVIIGNSCSSQAECTQKNSKCSKWRICSCVAQSLKYNEVKDECEPRISNNNIKVRCSSANDCALLHGAVCDNNYCLCPNGTTCSLCQLNASCNAGMNCSSAIPGWLCSSSVNPGVQQCQISRKAKTSVICEVIKVNDPCKNNDNCAEVANATCQSGLCKCKEDALLFDEANLKCKPREVGDQCSSNSDCKYVNNTECQAGKCKCTTGYVSAGNTKLCQKCGLGLPCIANGDCSPFFPNTRCRTKLDCEATYIAENQTCRKIRFSDTCRADEDCTHLSLGSCINNKCRCVLGFNYDSATSTCQRSGIGAPCPDGEVDCALILSGQCTNGYCGCQDGKKYGDDYMCIPKVIGDSCQVDRNTSCPYKGSRCVQQKCACDDNYKVKVGSRGKYCDAKVRLDPCKSDYDCSLLIGKGVCVNKSCDCSVSSYPDPNDSTSCVQRGRGQNCSSNEECGYKGGICTQMSSDTYKVCGCMKTYNVSKPDCKLRVYGDDCHPEVSPCSKAHGLECVGNKCACLPGHLQDSSLLTCMAVLGARCENDTNCSSNVNFAVCDNTTAGSVCSCMEGYGMDEVTNIKISLIYS